MITVTVYYDDDLGLYIIDEPCGCYSHPDEPTTGHPYCNMPSDVALKLEEMGAATRMYADNRWIWVLGGDPVPQESTTYEDPVTGERYNVEVI